MYIIFKNKNTLYKKKNKKKKIFKNAMKSTHFG